MWRLLHFFIVKIKNIGFVEFGTSLLHNKPSPLPNLTPLGSIIKKDIVTTIWALYLRDLWSLNKTQNNLLTAWNNLLILTLDNKNNFVVEGFGDVKEAEKLINLCGNIYKKFKHLLKSEISKEELIKIISNNF